MRVSAVWRVLGIVVVVALAACGGTGQPPAPEPGETSTPGPGATGDPEPEAPPDGAESVTVWFPRIGDAGVWVEPETVTLDEPTPGVLRAAMTAIVRGDASNPDLATTFVPEGTEIVGVSIADGVAVVDFSAALTSEGRGSAQELAFAQQLAHTAAQFETVDAVVVHVDGEPITELWGHLGWSEPLTPDAAMVSPILIEEPDWGDALAAGPVTASGTSVTFEATVELRLLDPSGVVIEETFTTAAQPAVDQRGPWEHTFDAPAGTPGRWTIEATEPDPAAGEGRPPFRTRVQFEIR